MDVGRAGVGVGVGVGASAGVMVGTGVGISVGDPLPPHAPVTKAIGSNHKDVAKASFLIILPGSVSS